jgi:hypothetical protein
VRSAEQEQAQLTDAGEGGNQRKARHRPRRVAIAAVHQFGVCVDALIDDRQLPIVLAVQLSVEALKQFVVALVANDFIVACCGHPFPAHCTGNHPANPPSTATS